MTSTSAAACQPHAGDLFPQIQKLAARWTQSGNPLVGQVWRDGRWMKQADAPGCDHHLMFHVVFDALAAIKTRGIALLGEVHDNPDHHLFRAGILAGHTWLVTAGEGDRKIPTPAVVFEHIRQDQGPALAPHAQSLRPGHALGSAGNLMDALDWDKSGWPDKAMFEPLFAAALTAKLPILPGDAPRDLVRRAAKEGEASVSPEDRTRLKLDQPLEPRLRDALLTELEESHCGMMPKTAFGTMAFAQRYRDAHLADALLKAADTHGAAILLAGNGHVRADRGVPLYLRQRAPNRTVVTVMLVEVEDGKTDPKAYGLHDLDGRPIADFVVFTPRAERPDPCETMRAAMKRRQP